jgi:hypothetical protein
LNRDWDFVELIRRERETCIDAGRA